MKNKAVFKTASVALGLGVLLGLQHVSLGAEEKAEAKAAEATQEITGEVVDLMCYLDHGAKGQKHRGCASICIKKSGPVGLLSGEQLYLLVGDHQPLNEELSSKAAETLKFKGKVVERNGIKMLENAQLVK